MLYFSNRENNNNPKNIKRATKRTVLKGTEACCFDFTGIQGDYEETSRGIKGKASVKAQL